MASFKYLALCLMFLFGKGFSQGFHCYDNVSECNTRLRALMLDESAFTFGNDYTEMCSHIPPPGNCVNNNVTQKSMYSKIFNTTDETELANRVSGLSVLSVAYNAPAESYEACGHTFNVMAMNNVRVDPLRDFPRSMISLTYRPTITWTPANPNELYTVIMYDVHFTFLHGMYVNCRGGSWENCDTIWTHLPPGFFMPHQNPYTFLLFRQVNNQVFDVGTLRTTVRSMVIDTDAAPFLGLFSFPAFYNMYQSILGNPIAVNVIRAYGDPYTAREIKRRNSFDVCPWLISQLEVFHRIVENTGLSAVWSSPKYTRSLYSTNTYMPTLSVNLQASFVYNDDFRWTSCCTDYTFSRGAHSVDPFSDGSLPAVAVRSKPVITLTQTQLGWRQYQAMKDSTYLLLMLDVSPSLPYGTINGSVFLHWAVADIKNADIAFGREIWAYINPLPRATGTYMFLLFNQGVPTMREDVISGLCPNPPICLVNVQALLGAFNVSLPAGVRWFHVRRDSYVDLMYYSVYNIQTEREVCQSRPGYASPCPQRQTDCLPDSANRHFDRLTVTGLSFLTLAITMYRRLF